MIPESSWIIQNPLPTTIIHYHHLSSSIIHYPPLPSPCITMHHHASPIFTNHIQSSPCITRHETMWIWRLLFYPCGCGTLSFHSWIATHSQTTGSKPLHWLHPTVSHLTKQQKQYKTFFIIFIIHHKVTTDWFCNFLGNQHCALRMTTDWFWNFLGNQHLSQMKTQSHYKLVFQFS